MGSRERLNVLVVDRDDVTVDQLERYLTQQGYRVETRVDPIEAAPALRDDRTQLVILDISPDVPGGMDALRRIRKLDSDLCVIATTSAPSVRSAVTAMRQRAFHYLAKPIDLAELESVLQEAIREKGLRVDLEGRLNGEVGRRIRERRQSRELTLKQLANRTGLSLSLISQVELGKSAASMSTLHKLATGLHVPMAYFLETL